MDIQLQELLDKIRTEGLDAAQKESSRILAEAESRKASIIAEAEREAAAIRSKAESDAARADAAGRAALAQAARDIALGLKDGLQAMLAEIVRRDVSQAMGPEILAECIPAALRAIAGGSGDLEILAPPEQVKKLDSRLLERLSSELKRGVTIRPFAGLDAGFRIAEKDGAAYYDFSAAEVAKLLSRRLSPRLAEAVRSAVSGI